MKIGILETGAPPSVLRERFGDYPAMFRDLLGPGFDYAAYDVRGSEFPEPEACGGYVITGAAAGVYDDVAWIAPMMDWLRAARGRTRLVGVCFGHQIMAEAFGGKVIQSPKGWGVGLHRYDVVHGEPWLQPKADHFAIAASHQDQVVEQPPGTDLVAASDFTPLAMLSWQDGSSISMQGHPEFAPDYATALIECRMEGRYAPGQGEAAIESFRQPNDRLEVGAWMRAFLSA